MDVGCLLGVCLSTIGRSKCVLKDRRTTTRHDEGRSTHYNTYDSYLDRSKVLNFLRLLVSILRENGKESHVKTPDVC